MGIVIRNHSNAGYLITVGRDIEGLYIQMDERTINLKQSNGVLNEIVH
jgi:hypothetical protein